jgi:RND family efflux transporter MFP subunit
LALALLAAACSGQGESDKADAAAGPGPIVTVIAIDSAGAAGDVRASGAIAFQREVTLSFKVGGVIQSIRVDEGDVVRAKQTLASLNLTELSAGVSEADAALRTAEAQFARAKTLSDKGLVAQARLDDAQLALDRAKAARQTVGFNRNQGVITAPADGVILRRRAEPNQNVAPGAPVLELGDVRSGLIARVGVAAAAASRIKVGDSAVARVEGVERAGKVTRIAAKSDAATGVFDVEVALADAKGLRSGQVADLVIKASGASAATAALRAPASALIDARADQGIVYVVDEANVARRRTVQTAGLDGDFVVILSGVQAGERIISAGAAYVREGQTVTPAAPTP